MLMLIGIIFGSLFVIFHLPMLFYKLYLLTRPNANNWLKVRIICERIMIVTFYIIVILANLLLLYIFIKGFLVIFF